MLHVHTPVQKHDPKSTSTCSQWKFVTALQVILYITATCTEALTFLLLTIYQLCFCRRPYHPFSALPILQSKILMPTVSGKCLKFLEKVIISLIFANNIAWHIWHDVFGTYRSKDKNNQGSEVERKGSLALSQLVEAFWGLYICMTQPRLHECCKFMLVQKRVSLFQGPRLAIQNCSFIAFGDMKADVFTLWWEGGENALLEAEKDKSYGGGAGVLCKYCKGRGNFN